MSEDNLSALDHKSELDELAEELLLAYAKIGELAFPEISSLLQYAESSAVVHDVMKRMEAIRAEQEREELEKALQSGQIICPDCQTVNLEGSLFCGECGIKLSVQVKTLCPHCGASVTEESRFCPECGQKLDSDQEPVCPACQLKIRSGARFCPECGTKVD